MATQSTGFSRSLLFEGGKSYQVLYHIEKKIAMPNEYVMYFYIDFHFLDEKIDLIGWFLCAASFNMFSSILLHLP